MSRLTIALAQADFPFGDLCGNLSKAEALVRKASGLGADLILLPESFNRGYSFSGTRQLMDWSEPLDGPTVTAMKKLARALGIHILCPLLIRVSDPICENTAVLISDSGEIIGTYAKTHLVPGGEADLLHAGGEYPVFSTKFGKIGIMICFDLKFPESALRLCENGAELILVTAAWANRNHRWNIFLQARAMENAIPIAAVNRVGPVDQAHFGGDSMILDSKGLIVDSAPSVGEKLVIHEIEI